MGDWKRVLVVGVLVRGNGSGVWERKEVEKRRL